MPRKGKVKKGRGRSKRKGAAKSKKMTINQVPGSGFQADCEKVTLRYTDQLIITQGASSGALSVLNYGINTPRIPDRSSGSTPCQGWANMIARYDRYLATGSRIRWSATLFNGTTAGTAAASNCVLMNAVLCPVGSFSSVPVSVREAAVQKYSTKRYEFAMIVPAGQVLTTASVNNHLRWSGSHAMSVTKIDGEPNLRQNQYEATVSADPTSAPLWVFAFQDVLADTTYKGAFLFDVDIEYDCIFFERVTVDNVFRTGPPELRVMKSPVSKVPLGQEHKSNVPDGYVLVKAAPGQKS